MEKVTDKLDQTLETIMGDIVIWICIVALGVWACLKLVKRY
jgi:hypothetical protein